ncbi:hypothetical protein PGPR2_05160 [Pseudomonas aeruginosa PGPR2]|nr:hypothetical protein PGPR2_05160 [Pseudomonas aeruginosa PGPR2]
MDYSPIVAQVWGMLTWFIPAALLIGLLKSPWAKGQIGELLVRLFAHWQLDRQTSRNCNFQLYRQLWKYILGIFQAPNQSLDRFVTGNAGAPIPERFEQSVKIKSK